MTRWIRNHAGQLPRESWSGSLGIVPHADGSFSEAALGHSGTQIIRDLYQHVRVAVADEAAAAVESLVTRRERASETGS